MPSSAAGKFEPAVAIDIAPWSFRSRRGRPPGCRVCNNGRVTPEEKLRLAFEFHESGKRLMEQNLRRRYPAETDEQIKQRLGEWLRERPGAEFGDGAGRGWYAGDRQR